MELRGWSLITYAPPAARKALFATQFSIPFQWKSTIESQPSYALQPIDHGISATQYRATHSSQCTQQFRTETGHLQVLALWSWTSVATQLCHFLPHTSEHSTVLTGLWTLRRWRRGLRCIVEYNCACTYASRNQPFQ